MSMIFTLMQNRATVIAMDVSRQGKRRSSNRITLRVRSRYFTLGGVPLHLALSVPSVIFSLVQLTKRSTREK